MEEDEKMRLKNDLDEVIHERHYNTPDGKVVFVTVVEPEGLKEVLTRVIEAL